MLRGGVRRLEGPGVRRSALPQLKWMWLFLLGRLIVVVHPLEENSPRQRPRELAPWFGRRKDGRLLRGENSMFLKRLLRLFREIGGAFSTGPCVGGGGWSRDCYGANCGWEFPGSRLR